MWKHAANKMYKLTVAVTRGDDEIRCLRMSSSCGRVLFLTFIIRPNEPTHTNNVSKNHFFPLLEGDTLSTPVPPPFFFWSFYPAVIEKVKKVKVTLVQALRLCTGRTAHRGSIGIALPFHDHGTRGGEGSASRPAALYPWERPGTHRIGG